MDKYTLQALNDIIDYMYDDEFNHWEEEDKPKEHIFTKIKLVSDWVDAELKK